MKRRDIIRMTPDEVEEFIHGRHTMAIASHGPSGRIHMVAMWYGFVNGDLAMWSFPKAQKIQNLHRDPRLTCLVEDGEDYGSLRGVELSGIGEVIEDPAYVKDLGWSLQERYMGATRGSSASIAAFLDDQAVKRVAVRIVVQRTATWDHRKLGGTY